MPHLSPMSWTISIITFWTSLTILMSTFWWNKNQVFNSSSNSHHTQKEVFWKWS